MRRIHFPSTDSTNLQARRLAAESPGESLLVVADVQTDGRGRSDRAWHSPPGGAWLSVVWPMTPDRGDLPTNREAPSAVPLVAAVAVLEALAELAPEVADRLAIKWPNDLLIDECKVAGILCERLSPANGTPGAYVIGVGVNVELDPANLPPGLRRPATSLSRAAGRRIGVARAVDAIGARLQAALEELDATPMPERILGVLRSRLAHVGLQQTWDVGGRSVEGVVLGLDAHGRLRLDASGREITLSSGELVEPARRP